MALKVSVMNVLRPGLATNWSPEAMQPVSALTPMACAAAHSRRMSVLSAGISILLMPEIRPTGSPMAEVSMSCCTTQEDTARLPMVSSSVSVPATPVLMTASGA